MASARWLLSLSPRAAAAPARLPAVNAAAAAFSQTRAISTTTAAVTLKTASPYLANVPGWKAVAQQQQQPSRSVFSCIGSRRWYSAGSSSSSPPAGKMWTFEEISSIVNSSSASASASTSPKVTLVDVREPGELAGSGRIPGAVNIPVTSQPDALYLSSDEFEDRFGFDKPDTSAGAEDQELVFYCKAGVRSRAAAGLARDAGFQNVSEYPGSWVDWVAKGGKVER